MNTSGWSSCFLLILLLLVLSQAVRLLTGHQSYLTRKIPSLASLKRSLFSMWVQDKTLENPCVIKHSTNLYYFVHIMRNTHTLEWLMSSRVAEAVRYLNGQNKHRLTDYCTDTIESLRQSLEYFPSLRNRSALRPCVVSDLSRQWFRCLKPVKLSMVFKQLANITMFVRTKVHIRGWGLDLLPSFG